MQDQSNNGATWDIVVVGAGHAGVEAALAAARMGCRVALVTARPDLLACMPCNPSIGGIAKSHLVFELDALGGEMAAATDRAGLQFRVLNASRGPAVRSNRVQCDKRHYSQLMQKVIQGTSGISLICDDVTGLCVQGSDNLRGIGTARHGQLHARQVILTTGTALAGTIHIGKEVAPGGGDGRPASEALSRNLCEHGIGLTRFKTGTPPRLDGLTIDWARMTVQPGETNPVPLFSWKGRRELSEGRFSGLIDPRLASNAMFHVEQPPGRKNQLFHVEQGQIPCWLTHTTGQTHAIIRDNLARSALYGGGIVGTGVRYCPSIEDKVVKFPDKDQHHVFLEPEHLGSVSIYPNGISNSLDRDVQTALVRSITGLEKATILAYAYAIEYDCVDTTTLQPTLECRTIHGLYFAGQINRTTGYEEAAAQGFVAGVNAALAAHGKPPFILSRQEAYIGVLVDDLVTKGTDEPYRMFTSRAERRLLLRQDNARFRMFEHAKRLGIADPGFLDETASIALTIEDEMSRLGCEHIDGVFHNQLMAGGWTYDELPGAKHDLPLDVKEQIAIRVKYQGYIAQEEKNVLRAMRLERRQIPAGFDYKALSSLRVEAREKFTKMRPISIGQASRIPGITPADIDVLSIALAACRP